MKKLLGFLGLALLLLIAVLAFNTFHKKPFSASVQAKPLMAMPDSAPAHISRAVQIPTISISDSSAIDTTAFLSFSLFLQQAYPLVHQHLMKATVGGFSYIFQWRGQDSSLQPIVLMGHYDVVPVEAAALDKWTVPPFSGTITDSCVWGRGSVDDKVGVISILEAAEFLLRKGFVPKRSIYLCFGHNEEVSGAGARAIVDWLADHQVHPEMVLDEGGEITAGKMTDVKRPIAVIGVAEKGYASYELSVEKPGGHSSMPAKETAISILVSGLAKLHGKNPPARITPPVREFLTRVGTSSDKLMNRMATANMWLFEGMTKSILSDKPEGNAMIHTTLVPTILSSGVKDNVIPSNARAIVNSRILPGETSKSVEDFIRTTVSDERIQVRKLGKFDTDPSTSTDINSPAFKRVQAAVAATVPDVLPTPYLMIGATDSRYYRRISDGVVNFLPMTDSKGFHGVNERLPLEDLRRAINFMVTMISDSNQDFR